MGYLDNSSVTIDAILTVKGRELLAQGANNFKITQFALGDDEIDYTLWNSDHPLGTAYYGFSETGVTQWDEPTGPIEKPKSPPAGWKILNSPCNNIYYRPV